MADLTKSGQQSCVIRECSSGNSRLCRPIGNLLLEVLYVRLNVVISGAPFDPYQSLLIPDVAG